MEILVTGATGFTGSHLAKRLISKGHKVRCLVRRSSNYSHLDEAGCVMFFGDLRDHVAVDAAVNGVDYIFNIAAVFRTWGLHDSVYYDTHVGGAKNLLESAKKHKIKRFIHCSTIGVHGSIQNPPGNEESPYNPGDIYQVTKLQAEQFVGNFCKDNNISYTIIRPAGIYGPEDLRFVKLFKSIARKRFLMIGNGETLWHPVYIDDLITGFELAMVAPGADRQTFILGGPEYLSLNALTHHIANELNVTIPKFHIPAKPIQTLGSICESMCRPFKIKPPLFRSRVDFFVKNRAFNISKAKQLLGYNPKYDIMTGIKLTVNWYSENSLL